MATLVLVPIAAGIAANATAGLGATAAAVATSAIIGVAGTVGALVDQMYVYPAIFGNGASQIKGPQLNNVAITGASAGTPINFCLGRENRVGGCIIWVSNLRKTASNAGSGGKGGTNVTTYQYFVDIAIAWGEGTINAIRKIWADGKLIYDQALQNNNSGQSNLYDSLINYFGDQTTPDPTISAAEGSSNTPSFVNTYYTVINNFAIHDWGNRIPNFTALVEAEEQTLLGDAIVKIWERTGRPGSDLDVSWVSDVEVLGYTLAGPQNPINSIEPLMMAYDLITQEQHGGVMHFYHRKDMLPVSVASNVLAAGAEKDTPLRAFQITDNADWEVVDEVDVTYTDPATFWQQGMQREVKSDITNRSVSSMSLPFTLDANSAKQIAARVLWSAQVERWASQMTLAPSQLHILEGDVLQLTADSLTWRNRITTVSRGQNFVYELHGSAEQSGVLDQSGLVADIPIIPPQPEPAGTSTHTGIMMEIPILPWEGYDRGIHFAVFAEPGDDWQGGSVYLSKTDNGDGSYWLMADYQIEATGGAAQNILPASGPIGYWDNTTTLVVTMNNGQFFSNLESLVLTGYFNHVYVGKPDGTGEVIAFCNATLTGPNEYTLSKLLRGRMGTEDRMAGHLVGDAVVLLQQDGSIHFHPYNTDGLGKNLFFKTVPLHRHLSDVAAANYYRSARSVTPFSPVKIKGVRDGSNNLTISWFRRTNEWAPIFDFPDAANLPENFPSDEYDIYIYNASGSTLLRTYLNYTGGESILYSAAVQTSDGITPGDTVQVIVYQVNSALSLNGGKGVASAQTTI